MRDSTPPHLRHAIAEMTTGESREEEPGLPTLRDNEFRAYARPSHKPLFSIHFIAATGMVRSFQYMHLDSGGSFSPGRIVLRFIGSKIVDVAIEGRNLWELYDYIHQHRMPWVRTAGRDFAQDGEPIVTVVSVIDSTASLNGAP